MARVKVEFEIEIPDVRHTEGELVDWLRFEIGDNGQLSESNPLSSFQAEPIFGTFEIS